MDEEDYFDENLGLVYPKENYDGDLESTDRE